MPVIVKWWSQKVNPSVISLLLGGLLFRIIVAIWLPPGFDEAYYYMYSQHLDWSYFDHPALVALTTGLGTWLTGEVSPFTIRWGALLLHTVSLWLLYLTSARLFNNQVAKLTLAIATIIPIFQFAFGILTLPDCPLIFFWSASLYCAATEFFPHQVISRNAKNYYQPSYRLAILGVLIGLACLGKYHGFVLGLSLVGFCLTSPPHRRALASPWTFLGLALFIWTLFPLWFWNIKHDWISFTFQLSARFEPAPGEIKANGYSLLGVLIAFLSGIGYLFPTMGFPLWWVSFKALFVRKKEVVNRKKIQRLKEKYSEKYLDNKSNYQQQKQWLILCLSLPLTLGFTLLGGKEAILPTWSMPGFWSLTLLLGLKAATWQQQSQRRVKRWLRGTAIFLVSLTLFALLHMNLGTLQTPSQYAIFGGLIAPKNDPSRELIDIKQLRQAVINSPLLTEALSNSSFIFTNAYYLSGYVGMALSPITSIPITCFGNDIRGFAFWSQPKQWLGKDGLYITLERFHTMPGISDDFSNYFQEFEVITTIPLQRGGAVTDTFYVYRARNFLKLYPSLPKVSH